MNNDSVQYEEVINLIINNDTSIIPYEKAMEYVNVFKTWLICKLRMILNNNSHVSKEIYQTTIRHCKRILEASSNDGSYNEGFLDGLQFAIDYFEWLKSTDNM